MTLVNLSLRVLKGAAGLLVGMILGMATIGLSAQETPRSNRLAWFEGFPEPLPEGVPEVALESTSQMLRPDLERSADGRSFARLDGEAWQLTGDWALKAGSSRFNLRARVAHRSGGIADQAIWNWHQLFNMPQGGREDAPKNRLVYHLERDGRVIGDGKPGPVTASLIAAFRERTKVDGEIIFE